MIKFQMCVVTVLLTCSGCAVFSPEDRPHYNVMVRNSTASDLSAVSIKFDDHNFGGGWLSSGADKTYFFSPVPIAEKANMSWVDAEGNHHAATLEVLKALPPKSSWENSFTIVFAFSDKDKVTVSYEAEFPHLKEIEAIKRE